MKRLIEYFSSSWNRYRASSNERRLQKELSELQDERFQLKQRVLELESELAVTQKSLGFLSNAMEVEHKYVDMLIIQHGVRVGDGERHAGNHS